MPLKRARLCLFYFTITPRRTATLIVLMELKDFKPFFKLSMASQYSFSIGNWRTIWTPKWLMVSVLTTGLKRSRGLKTANMLSAALTSTHWHARSYRLAGECGNSVYQREKSLHHVQTHTQTHTHFQPLLKQLRMCWTIIKMPVVLRAQGASWENLNAQEVDVLWLPKEGPVITRAFSILRISGTPAAGEVSVICICYSRAQPSATAPKKTTTKASR